MLERFRDPRNGSVECVHDSQGQSLQYPSTIFFARVLFNLDVKSWKLSYHANVSTLITRGHRNNWSSSDAFTVSDATELYEVDRWGKGYFSISPAGHLVVHPTKDV